MDQVSIEDFIASQNEHSPAIKMQIKLPCMLGSPIKMTDWQGTHEGWLVYVGKGLFCDFEYKVQTSKTVIQRWNIWDTKNVAEGKVKIDTYGAEPVIINCPFSFEKEEITHFGLKGRNMRFFGIWYDLLKKEYHYRFMDNSRLKTYIVSNLI